MDHKQKVSDELDELQEKIIKLKDFIAHNENYKMLNETQRNLLVIQENAMETYAVTLAARLDFWE